MEWPLNGSVAIRTKQSRYEAQSLLVDGSSYMIQVGHPTKQVGPPYFGNRTLIRRLSKQQERDLRKLRKRLFQARWVKQEPQSSTRRCIVGRGSLTASYQGWKPVPGQVEFVFLTQSMWSVSFAVLLCLTSHSAEDYRRTSAHTSTLGHAQ
jgi:hypothetical protein